MHEVLDRLLMELRNAWRFRWPALGIAWVVALAGWVYVYSLPNVYQAHAKVHVDTASILRPLLNGLAIQPDLNQEVRLLTKTLLNRANLEQVARKSNLDLGALSPTGKDALLRGLAHSIHIQGLGQDLYRINYASTDPSTAQAVVQQVLNIMMADALGNTNQSSTAAQNFLQAQVTDYANKLNKAEQSLAKFKRENIGYLPNESGNYFSSLQSAQQKLADLKNELAIAQTQYAALKSQTRPMLRPDSDPLIAALNKQILSDERSLNDMLTQYTSAYPGVIALRERIKLEKQQRTQMVKQFMQGNGQAAQPDSIAYQNLLQQQSEAAVKIQTLQQKIQQTQGAITGLKSGADKLTSVEAELGALTRNYNVTRKKYDQLLNRLYTAQLSQSAQQSGNPLKFQVIEPPVKPLLPAGPKRHLMSLVVLVGALGAGLAFAYLLALLKPVFMTRSDLSETLGLPVIGAVSLAATNSYLRARRVGVMGFALATIVLLVGGVAVAAFANHGAQLLHTKL
ncbi:XrtA system polysaccharide chain length determinant [Acidihalobacter ferrooxydans]|uniref:Tyrosine kinase G-rich domain-containing protein n=1 Tax=Acidihalobacter ferrooxydans TaxID=1765967 RepID=A0A1P8UI16_9GAMM|nr:XrtA system polysaccharide chain length determinant [Acidihalobacter ferrooxydans]APZ43495.1 hypothetical protein BW247_10675 [Acidihalobacter ferrooxydans]